MTFRPKPRCAGGDTGGPPRSRHSTKSSPASTVQLALIWPSIALLTLIDTPKGARPAPVVVGTPYGVDEVNRLTQPVQRAVLEGLGLAGLDSLA